MKKTCFLLLSTELFFGAYAFAATPEIKLSGRKDRVLSYQMRERVLAVAESHLNQVNGGFGTKIEALDNPYVFKEVVEFVPRVADQKSDLIDASVVYDDASILAVIGLNLAKQVSGTLARGTTHYLQLQGGGMLKSGASFPAKIPQVAGQSFNVTLMDVNSAGYTLKMGDASLTLPFDASSSVSAGVTKDSTQ
jgi:hypothetical protein